MYRQAGMVILVAGVAFAVSNSTKAGSYAELRIRTAFQVAAEIPPIWADRIPFAKKGDRLAIGCARPVGLAATVGCVDTANRLVSEHSIVLEIPRGQETTELMRLDPVVMTSH